MSLRYVVKPGADRDLDEYADHLAERGSIELAIRFLDAARGTFRLLASQPKIGWRSRIKHPGLEGLRVFRVKGFEHMLVFYRPLSPLIEVLRIVHGSRNLHSMLRREGLD